MYEEHIYNLLFGILAVLKQAYSFNCLVLKCTIFQVHIQTVLLDNFQRPYQESIFNQQLHIHLHHI